MLLDSSVDLRTLGRKRGKSRHKVILGEERLRQGGDGQASRSEEDLGCINDGDGMRSSSVIHGKHPHVLTQNIQ